jgi:DNA-3-methyladenine glycosylase II
VRSVVSQQLSVSAARTIFGRLADKTNLQREKILQLTPEEMKVIGLSSQKQNYIKDLAVHFMENDYSDSTFDTMSDDDVITHLVKIKGIGEWTAQMFLMFTLRRPDVFAPGDRGLQVAINRLYGVGGDKPKPSELVEFAERWAPYRTTACMYLWESLENS